MNSKSFKQFIQVSIFFAFIAATYLFFANQIYNLVKSDSVVITYAPFDIDTAVHETRLFLEDQTLLTKDETYIFVSMDDIGMGGSRIEIAKTDGSFRKEVAYSPNIWYFTTPILNNDESKFAYFRIFPMEVWVYDLKTNTEEMVYSELERVERNIFNPRVGHLGKVLDVYWDENNNLRFKDMSELPHQEYAIDINTKDIAEVPPLAMPGGRQERGIGGVNSGYKQLEITKYSQRDKSWTNEQLGACENETMGSAGCAVTAVSMLLDYYGYELNPEELNEKLRENMDMGYIGCAIRWNMVPNLANDGKLVMKLVGFNKYDLDRVDYELSLGNPVIAGFNSVNFIDIPHWVLITGKTPDGVYLTNDPWTGEQKTLDYFGSRFDHMIVYEKI
jgi:hypothetical protein